MSRMSDQELQTQFYDLNFLEFVLQGWQIGQFRNGGLTEYDLWFEFAKALVVICYLRYRCLDERAEGWGCALKLAA